MATKKLPKQPKPPPYVKPDQPVRATFVIDHRTDQHIDRLSKLLGVTRSALVRAAIDQVVNQTVMPYASITLDYGEDTEGEVPMRQKRPYPYGEGGAPRRGKR